MARTEEIRIKVRDYILREFLDGEEDSRLTNDTPLITGGILDSIGTVRLATHLEQEYQMILEQRDITVQHFDTVDGIASLVERKLAGT